MTGPTCLSSRSSSAEAGSSGCVIVFWGLTNIVPIARQRPRWHPVDLQWYLSHLERRFIEDKN